MATAGNAALARIEVEGWSLALDAGEPLVRDVDLAERLGYDRPRKLRELVKRMQKEGEIAGVHWCPTVGRQSTGHGGTREFTTNEALLTEEQALLVAVRSETPKAMEVRRTLVRVFVAARRGLIQPANAPPAMIDPGQIAAIVARAVAETVPAVLAGLRAAERASVAAALPTAATGRQAGRKWERHPILSIEERIAAARKVDALLIFLRMTPAEFAKKAGLGDSYLSKLMKGERGIGMRAGAKIEKAHGIDRRYWDSASAARPAQFRVGGKGKAG